VYQKAFDSPQAWDARVSRRNDDRERGLRESVSQGRWLMGTARARALDRYTYRCMLDHGGA